MSSVFTPCCGIRGRVIISRCGVVISEAYLLCSIQLCEDVVRYHSEPGPRRRHGGGVWNGGQVPGALRYGIKERQIRFRAIMVELVESAVWCHV